MQDAGVTDRPEILLADSLIVCVYGIARPYLYNINILGGLIFVRIALWERKAVFVYGVLRRYDA